MSIDYLSEIKPLEDQGISFANIAVHVNSKTLMPLMPDSAKYELADSGAVLQDPVRINERSGTLIDYYQALEAGDSKDLIAFFLGRIYGDQPVATDQYPRSIQFASVEASLPESLKEVSAKLVESAGGRPHSGVTEQDVIDAKAAWEQEEADRIAEEARKAAEEAAAREEKKAEEERQRQIDEKLQANDAQFWSLFNQHVAILKDNREVDGWQAAIQAMANGWVE
jgi:hypothetical protein